MIGAPAELRLRCVTRNPDDLYPTATDVISNVIEDGEITKEFLIYKSGEGEALLPADHGGAVPCPDEEGSEESMGVLPPLFRSRQRHDGHRTAENRRTWQPLEKKCLRTGIDETEGVWLFKR